MTDDDIPVHDIHTTFVHLGLGATAVPLPDFEFTPERLEAYEEMSASDSVEGRLVSFGRHGADWSVWERHPAGDEVVLVVSGRLVAHQEIDGQDRTVELGPGQFIVNPPGVWHTADVVEPGDALFITAGLGTEHRAR
jgi:mannose-6-phosphate isomerase-like protein (cupin superfamily)